TKSAGVRLMTGSAQASVSKTSGRTTVDLGYHRGYTTVFPLSNVWHGDTATVYVVQSLSRRMSIHANAAYFRGGALLGSALANSKYGGAGLDVVIQNNLVVSTNYFLTSQSLANVALAGTNLHRSTAMVGINYYLPSVARR